MNPRALPDGYLGNQYPPQKKKKIKEPGPAAVKGRTRSGVCRDEKQ